MDKSELLKQIKELLDEVIEDKLKVIKVNENLEIDNEVLKKYDVADTSIARNEGIITINQDKINVFRSFENGLEFILSKDDI